MINEHIEKHLTFENLIRLVKELKKNEKKPIHGSYWFFKKEAINHFRSLFSIN